MPPETILLLLIAAIGAIYDWRTRKIPNWLTVYSLPVIFLLNIVHAGLWGFVNSLLGLLAGLALLFIPYIIGGMGAGDVKLLGSLGAIVGYKGAILIFFYTALCGLVLGIIWLIFNPGRLKFLITTGQILPTVDKNQKIPYGIAILMGTILYITFGANNLFNIIIWQ
ncbi:MAG: hypothetical protein A3F80_03790 [Candidatus Melainabacteria bacterium RIFCSPLOWO2_12_FULL_35_11]|nr:MAG: hypothetical protein A3F80_03790 [Candidatus Melainabacteria bacterium RIFCSPLOWO2_12_FULL_35_11]